MKKISLILIMLLCACSTQTPIQPTQSPTSTPAPTATAIPTPTVNPAFLAVQEQLAGAGQDYSIMSNGDIQAKRPDGTIGVIPGIKLNPDGKGYAIMVNGAEVTIDTDKVSITDGGIKVDGYAYDSANLGFDKIVVYDSATWSAMDQTARDEALAQLPATTDEGYTRGGFSTIEGMSHHVIYYGVNGDYAGSQNLLTGKFEKTGTGAIEVFRTEDGGYYEMRAYGKEGMDEEQTRKVVQQMLYDAIVVDGATYGKSYNDWPDIFEQARAMDMVVGFEVDPDFINMVEVPNSPERLRIEGQSFANGVVFKYPSDDKVLKRDFLRGTTAEELRKILTDKENSVIPARP